MTPTEALRRARATMMCGGEGKRGCIITQYANATNEWPWSDSLECCPSESHPYAASALLDGYSIAEITKAGG